ncbi:hypothetical protein ED236_08905 [Pseudomethylobacillus aquaticus]|uniref:PepSY domain-containing protein n=1 Tax=Pseudomethylobacillus aquaticus TaxID=2676064 RepID=A0A3N0UZH2_9PROT|nr:hypothetical protein ED236_08905 [Pseudomethylobacillus aquaticus]
MELILDRVFLVKLHLLLATFILPVALMFFVTGGFYTWGIKGSYDSQHFDIALQQPLSSDKDALVALASQELASRGIELPSGSAGVRKVGTSFQLEWSGAARDVSLSPTEDPALARLEVKDTRWYRHLVQLHKAKGGTPFKVYAAVMATALLLLLVSGFIMAWQMPKYRRMTVRATLAGIVSFVVLLSLS